jgi:hypothetical protein
MDEIQTNNWIFLVDLTDCYLIQANPKDLKKQDIYDLLKTIPHSLDIGLLYVTPNHILFHQLNQKLL